MVRIAYTAVGQSPERGSVSGVPAEAGYGRYPASAGTPGAHIRITNATFMSRWLPAGTAAYCRKARSG